MTQIYIIFYKNQTNDNIFSHILKFIVLLEAYTGFNFL